MVLEADKDLDGAISEQEFMRVIKKTSLYWLGMWLKFNYFDNSMIDVWYVALIYEKSIIFMQITKIQSILIGHPFTNVLMNVSFILKWRKI